MIPCINIEKLYLFRLGGLSKITFLVTRCLLNIEKRKKYVVMFILPLFFYTYSFQAIKFKVHGVLTTTGCSKKELLLEHPGYENMIMILEVNISIVNNDEMIND